MPRIPTKQTPDPRRPKRTWNGEAEQDKRYWSPAWRKARLAFLKHNPTCKECGRFASVVDHVNPVRLGGEFWDSDNWQAMCAPCHNAKSAKERHHGKNSKG